MAGTDNSKRKRILDPIDRIIEAIFGLVMVLTFTCTLSAVDATRADVNSMMVAAIGCNVAWGLVDGVMYLFARISQQLQGVGVLLAVRGADAAEASRALAGALPAVVVEAMTPRGLDDLRARIRDLPTPPDRVSVSTRDWLGAVGIFVIAVLSVAPLLLPFVLMDDVLPAMRTSNGIALVMLFLLGQQWAQLVGLPRWQVGFAMALGGALIVAVTVALGG